MTLTADEPDPAMPWSRKRHLEEAWDLLACANQRYDTAASDYAMAEAGALASLATAHFLAADHSPVGSHALGRPPH